MTTVGATTINEHDTVSRASNVPVNDQVFVTELRWRRVSLAISGWVVGVLCVMLAAAVAVGASVNVKPGQRPLASADFEANTQAEVAEESAPSEAEMLVTAGNGTSRKNPTRTNPAAGPQQQRGSAPSTAPTDPVGAEPGGSFVFDEGLGLPGSDDVVESDGLFVPGDEAEKLTESGESAEFDDVVESGESTELDEVVESDESTELDEVVEPQTPGESAEFDDVVESGESTELDEVVEPQTPGESTEVPSELDEVPELDGPDELPRPLELALASPERGV